MKIYSVLLMFVAILLIPAASSAIDIKDIDVSQPFPLSLIDYPISNDPFDPWVNLDVDNIQINTDNTTQLQNEEMVYINPTNTANAVALWRDFREGYRRIGVGYTFDGGQTWNDELLVVPPHPRASDPVLSIDKDGNFIACSLCLPWDGSFSGIFIQKSTDGGISWSDPVTAIDSQFAFFEDKQWMAVDRTNLETEGNIYIPWARFDADLSRNQVCLIYSHDRGETFSDPVSVSEGRSIQWPTVTVGSAGEVYVAWYSSNPRGIFFDVSYNYGMSFNTDRLIASIETRSTQINGDVLVFPYPALASDINPTSPFTGYLYMVNMDLNRDDMDIYFRRSYDGGETWSDRVRVNDDNEFNGRDQFHPWISVDNTGKIHVIFYDRRLDPQNMLFDLYYTYSEDGGETWSPNERITTESSDPRDARLAGLIGEYIGLSSWEGETQMVWTDTRNGNQDVFSGRMSQTAIDNGIEPLPAEMALKSPYPNPFNSSTEISFYAAGSTPVSLTIVDILGRDVCTLFKGNSAIGLNRYIWNGQDNRGGDTASGVYFAKLSGDNWIQVKKAVLLR